MSEIEHIRKKLKLSQAELAEVAGVSQSTVSRWEQGKLEPNRDEMDRMRIKAAELNIPWDDSWFFEVPAEQVAS